MKLFVTAQGLCAAENVAVIEYAKTKFDEVLLNTTGRILTPEEVETNWGDCDAVIAGVEQYSAAMLSRAPKTLKVISRNGIGYEAIDVSAAKRLGITVTGTPNVNNEAVADLLIGDMLAICRNIPYFDRCLKEGKYMRSISRDLYGQTVGLIGFGAIGKSLAKRLVGFDCRILAYDPYFDKETAARYGVEEANLDTIFAESDFISPQPPVTNETEKMINAARLRSMKPTAYLVNAARCQLIDTEALKQALREHWIAGAAIDAVEPFMMEDKELLSLDNLVLSSHLGGHTVKCMHDMGHMAVDNAFAAVHGLKIPGRDITADL